MATYIKIATVTVGAGGQAAINFTSISNAYTDLKVVVSGRGDTASLFCGVRFNSSTTGYSSRNLEGNGTAASSQSRTDEYFPILNPNTYTASTFANAEIYVPNYLSSSNKSFSIDSVSENNATTAISKLSAGLWSNTAAITAINLVPLTANFVQHSTATLYGIKNS